MEFANKHAGGINYDFLPLDFKFKWGVACCEQGELDDAGIFLRQREMNSVGGMIFIAV